MPFGSVLSKLQEGGIRRTAIHDGKRPCDALPVAAILAWPGPDLDDGPSRKARIARTGRMGVWSVPRAETPRRESIVNQTGGAQAVFVDWQESDQATTLVTALRCMCSMALLVNDDALKLAALNQMNVKPVTVNRPIRVHGDAVAVRWIGVYSRPLTEGCFVVHSCLSALESCGCGVAEAEGEKPACSWERLDSSARCCSWDSCPRFYLLMSRA